MFKILALNLAGHSHPYPGQSKAESCLQEMIKDCAEKDLTKSPSGLSKGDGLPCLPAVVSLAGASVNTMRNIRKKFLVNNKEVSTVNNLKSFEMLILASWDERDDEEPEDHV